MRHVNLENKTPPEDWCRKAEELTSKLQDSTDTEERKKIIDEHTLWSDSEFKKWLRGLFYDKCWYSEAREVYSFYDVDHFRPKKRVKNLDGTEREGYWWLTYDWKNYRICGNISNRPNRDENGETRGKSDYFPLKEDSPIANSPSCDIRDENPYLLDPTDPDDPLLLTFNESGKPTPASLEGLWEYIRAEETIRILHLDYPPLVDERKKIWIKCNLLITEIENLMLSKMETTSAYNDAALKLKMADLRDMASEEAELSSTAKACLLSSGRRWAMNLACCV